MIFTEIFLAALLSLTAQNAKPLEGKAVGLSLPRKWTQCKADAECMLITLDCDQMASPKREHEEPASKYLRKRQPPKNNSKCKAGLSSAIFPQCRRNQCIAVQFSPKEIVCSSRLNFNQTTLSAKIHGAKTEKDCLTVCKGELGDGRKLGQKAKKSPLEFKCAYRGKTILAKKLVPGKGR